MRKIIEAMRQDSSRFFFREHHGESCTFFGPYNVIQPRQINAQNIEIPLHKATSKKEKVCRSLCHNLVRSAHKSIEWHRAPLLLVIELKLL